MPNPLSEMDVVDNIERLFGFGNMQYIVIDL